jgi:DNA-binding HxlR family transcriptional regulator
MHLEGTLADRDAWTADRCSVDRALSVIGTRTAMLVLREAAYGAHRFDEFARRVGVTDAVMAARLRQLTEHGLLRRRPYREPGQRTRFEYHLTEMGRDVLPALLALMQWGDRYLTGDDGPPLRVTHTDCGAPVETRVRCAEGHDVPTAEISVRRAPGRVTPDATP